MICNRQLQLAVRGDARATATDRRRARIARQVVPAGRQDHALTFVEARLNLDFAVDLVEYFEAELA